MKEKFIIRALKKKSVTNQKCKRLKNKFVIFVLCTTGWLLPPTSCCHSRKQGLRKPSILCFLHKFQPVWIHSQCPSFTSQLAQLICLCGYGWLRIYCISKVCRSHLHWVLLTLLDSNFTSVGSYWRKKEILPGKLLHNLLCALICLIFLKHCNGKSALGVLMSFDETGWLAWVCCAFSLHAWHICAAFVVAVT